MYKCVSEYMVIKCQKASYIQAVCGLRYAKN